jgi:hypothetical protein
LYADDKRHKEWMEISYSAIANRISEYKYKSLPRKTNKNK